MLHDSGHSSPTDRQLMEGEDYSQLTQGKWSTHWNPFRELERHRGERETILPLLISGVESFNNILNNVSLVTRRVGYEYLRLWCRG